MSAHRIWSQSLRKILVWRSYWKRFSSVLIWVVWGLSKSPGQGKGVSHVNGRFVFDAHLARPAGYGADSTKEQWCLPALVSPERTIPPLDPTSVIALKLVNLVLPMSPSYFLSYCPLLEPRESNFVKKWVHVWAFQVNASISSSPPSHFHSIL